jgi:enoyl-[acyl-carrier-protein] reductase (NADH)
VPHEEFRRRFLETTSLHSTVSAQDIANMVLFLCTPAGERITGQPISVDADVRYLV